LPHWIHRENSPIKLPAVFRSSSAEETFGIGKNLAALLHSGSIVALRGQLGAGKTCLVKGIASALGVTEEVTSATYTIVCEYDASSCPLYHIDAYRLQTPEDFSAIGGEDIIFGSGISLIEWSDRIEGFIPAEAIQVTIEIVDGNTRCIRIEQIDQKE